MEKLREEPGAHVQTSVFTSSCVPSKGSEGMGGPDVLLAGEACTSLRERREAAGWQGRPVLCGKGREVAGHHGRPELTGLSKLQREAGRGLLPPHSQFLSGIFSETVERLLLILTTGTRSGSGGKFSLPSGPVLSCSDLMILSSATRRRLTTTRTVSSASSAASCLSKPSLRCHHLTWPGPHQACPVPPRHPSSRSFPLSRLCATRTQEDGRSVGW